MAQFFKITEVFQATDKATKEPVTDSYGNTRWMFKVEGQTADGWMSVNRKAGSELNPGDHVYGIIDTWPDTGKAKFVRQNPPEGTEFPRNTSAPAKAAQKSAPSGNIEAKLDELLDRVKKLAAAFYAIHGGGEVEETVLEDIEDGPVNLDDIDY